MGLIKIIKTDFSYLYEQECSVIDELETASETADSAVEDAVDVALEVIATKNINAFYRKVKTLQHKIGGSKADKPDRAEAMRSLIDVTKDVLSDYASIVGSKSSINKMYNNINEKMFEYYNKKYGVG